MILNGTASTDDHEIVAWEWTKDAGDDTKAVDMQNTRTPYLQVTFKYGIYIFCRTENNSVFLLFTAFQFGGRYLHFRFKSN